MADDQPDHRLGEPSGWGGWLGRTARPLAVGLVVWPLIGCDPLSAMFEDVQRARRYRSEGEAGRRDPERLTV
ncbi:MAG: hypothetical protein ABEL76_06665, partial [Bradymonadaceae bacterium]